MGERAHETVGADVADPGGRTLAHSERKFGDFLPKNLQNWLYDKNLPSFFVLCWRDADMCLDEAVVSLLHFRIAFCQTT